MATLATIQDTVNQGTLYHGELVEELRADLLNGCDCDCSGKIICLQSCIYALQYDIDTDTNTDRTTRVYNVLQGLIAGFSAAFNLDPDVVIPNTIVVIAAGSIMQTTLVFPTAGTSSYTFAQLIGNEVLTVYRGVSVVLRAHSVAPDNEYAQFDIFTGEITVNSPFSSGESLWVEYRTT
jgi:hypothetical protein